MWLVNLFQYVNDTLYYNGAETAYYSTKHLEKGFISQIHAYAMANGGNVLNRIGDAHFTTVIISKNAMQMKAEYIQTHTHNIHSEYLKNRKYNE